MYPSIPKDLVDKRFDEILNDTNAPSTISSRLTSPHFIKLNAQSSSNPKASIIESKGKPVLRFGVYVQKHLESRAFGILDFICKLIEHRGMNSL